MSPIWVENHWYLAIKTIGKRDEIKIPFYYGLTRSWIHLREW